MNITSDDLTVNVFGYMPVPPERAYDAVADPAQLAAHFTTGGASGEMAPGAKVTWEFADFPGPFEVEVLRAERPSLIVFRWPSPPGADQAATEVTFRFIPADSGARTRIEVSESGWAPSPASLRAAQGNAMGWAYMLAAMKAWLEHGIVLRAGMFR
ncbi:MAG: SRPBCC domain-containing protein [Paracoccus sp. (in: a-proteobacteria)]|nr:SRPBCC domain-containing protein [Paracoccus sp. (in: a-proteobacteria)]